MAASLGLFGVSCGPLGGLFRPVCVLWVVFCDALGPRMRPRGPQEASGAAPQALQRPPGGIKKASPSSKSRFLLLCAEGVAGDAPQALSIRPPPRGRPCWTSVMRASARILSLQDPRALRRARPVLTESGASHLFKLFFRLLGLSWLLF